MKSAAARAQQAGVSAMEFASIEEAIHDLVTNKPQSPSFHRAQAAKFRARAAARRVRIGQLLRGLRPVMDGPQWDAFLASVSLTADQAADYMHEAAAEPPIGPTPKLQPGAPRSIYFIQGVDGGPIKIGCAQDPDRRLAVLQVGSPVRLRIVGIAPGGARREATLHRKLFAHRLHGEWFADAPEVRAAMAEALQ